MLLRLRRERRAPRTTRQPMTVWPPLLRLVALLPLLLLPLQA